MWASPRISKPPPLPSPANRFDCMLAAQGTGDVVSAPQEVGVACGAHEVSPRRMHEETMTVARRNRNPNEPRKRQSSCFRVVLPVVSCMPTGAVTFGPGV
eukprot:339270-Hanusia_phi.AAC.2